MTHAWTCCCLLLGSAAWLAAAEPDRPAPAAGAPAAGTPAAVPGLEQLAERALKSVAVITFTGRDGKQQGLGSGFVLSAEGLIATNLHVLGEARPIRVQLADGREFAVTAVEASDRQADLAILRIDAADLPALPLGDSDGLVQGQSVVALGNPHGLKNSVVAGIVSGVRTIDQRPMIQLAMPIEPGNSGGPLLDAAGRVQGIVTLKSLVTPNLGFAVAINRLKPLREKPNPIPIARWLTIGALSPRDWQTVGGAQWRGRAGRITVEGAGNGFGGRSLCLAQRKLPELPFDVAVAVKLDDEAGAAGLAFFADGEHRHYGFYPSAGKLRLTRFAGSDVLSWEVLADLPDESYRPGDWNTLRVRLDEHKISCYVNDRLVVESDDKAFRTGRVGLAKFRDTRAQFKQFQIAAHIARSDADAARRDEVARLLERVPAAGSFDGEWLEPLVADARLSIVEARRRAQLLDGQAARLRQLAARVHERQTLAELAKLLEAEDQDIDLARAALLLARLDNDEVDVEAYLAEIGRMGQEISAQLDAGADEHERRDALRKYLFEQNGFHGSRGDYYNRANSYLNEVIDDREGLPITLGVLYMALGRALNLKMLGVGLPGHFVVEHRPTAGDPQLIDVFDGAAELDRAAADKIVRDFADRDLVEADLAPLSARATLVRMLHNLLGVAGRASDAAGVLRYLDAILTVDPAAAQDRWMRAVVAFRSNRLETARADVAWLLDHKPETVNLDEVRQLGALLEK